MTFGHMPFGRVRVLRVPFRRGRAPGRTPPGLPGRALPASRSAPAFSVPAVGKAAENFAAAEYKPPL